MTVHSVKSKTTTIAVASCLLLLLTVFAAAYGRLIVIYKPIPFQAVGFAETVRWVTTHRTPEACVVALPSKLENFSSNSRAYVTGDYVFLPCWTGRETLLPNTLFAPDDYCEGYLYVKATISYDKQEGDIHQVTINAPMGRTGCAKRAMLVPESSMAKSGPLVLRRSPRGECFR